MGQVGPPRAIGLGLGEKDGAKSVGHVETRIERGGDVKQGKELPVLGRVGRGNQRGGAGPSASVARRRLAAPKY